MAIHPLALTQGLSREQIEHAVEAAEATVAIGNNPTMVLIIGRDASNQLIEATGVIRDEDVLFIHASTMRAGYAQLLEAALAQPGSEHNTLRDAQDHDRWSVDGLELTTELVTELKQRASTGHDVEVLRIRLRTGRPAPLSVGEVIRLELDPKTYDSYARRSDQDGTSVHQLIRNTLRDCVHAAQAS